MVYVNITMKYMSVRKLTNLFFDLPFPTFSKRIEKKEFKIRKKSAFLKQYKNKKLLYIEF